MDDNKYPTDELTSPKLRQVRGELTAWLSQKTFRIEDLKAWLKGYNLPGLGQDDAPHDWIKRVFPISNKDTNFECIMAKRIAELLDKEAPYKDNPTDDKLLYNLFYLSAKLNCKKELAKPLARVLDFLETHKDKSQEFFSKEKAYNLNSAFREALTSNQCDKKYIEIWKSLLRLEEPIYLRGNIFNGFLGILNISDGGQPAINDIGWALKKMIDYLEPDKKGHLKFRGLIQTIKNVWPEYQYLEEKLIDLAIKDNWPYWAVVRLESLLLRRAKGSDKIQNYIIWSIYLPFLRELKIYPEVKSQAGILVEIETSDQIELFLEKTSPTVEKVRLGSPDKSYANVLVAANQGFMELELYFRYKQEKALAAAIERGRIQILRTLGLDHYEETEIIEPTELERSLAQLTPLLENYTPFAPALYVTNVPQVLDFGRTYPNL
jgi:hypothetical protein